MRMSLLPCPGCARHVRTTESQCPFCARRIRRRSLVALGAAAGAAAAIACGSSSRAIYGAPDVDGTRSPFEDSGGRMYFPADPDAGPADEDAADDADGADGASDASDADDGS